jgi:hypothetical protein
MGRERGEMPVARIGRKLERVRSLVTILGLPFLGIVLLPAQNAPSNTLSDAQSHAVVGLALDNELRAAEDTTHPMRYCLRKSSPRLTSTKEIYESKDGDVARLLSINGQPLDPEAEQNEKSRLTELAGDPDRQRHRMQAEDADRAHAINVLRALSTAFTYRYAGIVESSAGLAERFTFQPNPGFSPPDLESQVLTAMTGEIWINAAQERVVRLQGHLQHDVDFGWGILGRLYKGGWIAINQAEVAPGQWRTVQLQMVMSGRLMFKSRNFDTTEDESDFAPLPPDIGYREAIEKLQSGAFDTEARKQ